MSDAPATPETDPAARRQAAVQRQAAILEQLAEAGLRLALTIEAEAAAAAAAGQSVRDDAAMAFSRAARAVRLTVMLQSRLMEGPPAPGALRAGADDAGAGGPFDGVWTPPDLYVPAEVQRGRQVQGIVRSAAEDAGRDAETVERLVAEAGERMQRDDIYFLVRSHPFGDLVAFICKELGLDPDWSRLAREAWDEAEDARDAARQSFHALAATGEGRRAARPRPAQTAAAARFAPAFHGSS